MSTKQLIKDALRSLGLQVRRPKLGRQIDPFADQQDLLKGRDVRCILDLGANIGQTALRYRRLFPEATVHSFEPYPEVFGKLEAACRVDPRIRPHQLAIADQSGSKKFFTSSHDEWGSLSPILERTPSDLFEAPVAISTKSETEVVASTLDDFCAREGIGGVQILKMDIQGGELLALRGAGGLLTAGSIDLIYSEVLFKRFYEDQCYFHDLSALLTSYDYTLFGLYNLNYGKHATLLVADAMWLSPRLWESLS